MPIKLTLRTWEIIIIVYFVTKNVWFIMYFLIDYSSRFVSADNGLFGTQSRKLIFGNTKNNKIIDHNI